jgi:hypothetical protein
LLRWPNARVRTAVDRECWVFRADEVAVQPCRSDKTSSHSNASAGSAVRTRSADAPCVKDTRSCALIVLMRRPRVWPCRRIAPPSTALGTRWYQCLLKEGCPSRGSRCAALHALQLCPNPPDASGHARDGGRRHRSAVVDRGYRRASGLNKSSEVAASLRLYCTWQPLRSKRP